MELSQYEVIQSNKNDCGATTDTEVQSQSKKCKDVWYEFSQSSTMHGINKITEYTPFMIRRVLWVVIILAGLSLCIRQMVMSVLYYREYPVTVNVKINYNSSIRFPAITVCNQNDFRSTAAERIGKYDLVRDYFSKLQEGGQDLEPWEKEYSLAELYEQTAHRKEDMIIECLWDENDCKNDSFKTTITDYGYCYTFNSGKNETELLYVSTTGADRGLHLLLNIEQYDYMKGPNPGAGIKLLIHAQDEVPLVRDLGQAVPPGSYAFVGLQMVEVNNLKPPHGICNDSLSLDFFPTYSISACMIECKQKYAVRHCGCRDVYMPSNDTEMNRFPPVCNMLQYQECFYPKMRDFHTVYKSLCDCPVPCRRTMYDTSITYASVSKYDTANLLKNNITDELQSRYQKAEETSHRVNKDILEMDRRLIHNFDRACLKIEKTIHQVKNMTHELSQRVHEDHHQIIDRVAFHKTWGVEKVVYIMHHDFIRGFLIHSERTFSAVSPFYLELVSYCQTVYIELTTRNLSDPQRFAMYETASAMISQKLVAAERAQSKISEVYNAYRKLKPLQKFEASPKRRYDMYWITKEMFTTKLAYTYKKEIVYALKNMTYALNSIKELIDKSLMSQNTSYSELVNSTDLYRASVKAFNFKIFLFKERIVSEPDVRAKSLQKIFMDYEAAYRYGHDQLDFYVDALRDFVNKADATLKHVTFLQDTANMHSQNPFISRTSLARNFTSEDTHSCKNSLETFFAELKSRSRNVNQLLNSLEMKTIGLWDKMISDTSVHQFYQKLHEDIELLEKGNNQTEKNVLVEIFAEMLDKNATFIQNNIPQLKAMMNADFVTTSTSAKNEEIKSAFSSLRALNDVGDAIIAESVFFGAFAKIQTELMEFLLHNEIDRQFYSENFMQVDVFMRDLSYEQIDQQVAYGLTSLWSDIGGTMGLLIGASVITVFEFLDVIICSLFNCKSKPKEKLKTSDNSFL